MCIAGTLSRVGQSVLGPANLSPFQGHATQNCTFPSAWRSKAMFIKHNAKEKKNPVIIYCSIFCKG